MDDARPPARSAARSHGRRPPSGTVRCKNPRTTPTLRHGPAPDPLDSVLLSERSGARTHGRRPPSDTVRYRIPWTTSAFRGSSSFFSILRPPCATLPHAGMVRRPRADLGHPEWPEPGALPGSDSDPRDVLYPALHSGASSAHHPGAPAVCSGRTLPYPTGVATGEAGEADGVATGVSPRAFVISAALRSASAAIVNVGLAVPVVGNRPDPARYRFW